MFYLFNILSLNVENIISIIGIGVSVSIAIISGTYASLTDTKKFELTESYRRELLLWHKEAVIIMRLIIQLCKQGIFYKSEFYLERIKLLSKLSSLAEEGRFYFPNVIKNDGYGKEKFEAYKGYRHIEIEFLLHFYFIASNDVLNENIELLEKLQRAFTSFIFDMLKPKERNKEYSKYLLITIPEGKTIEDVIKENYDIYE